MAVAHEAFRSEADKRELDRRTKLILESGYPGDTLMPIDLGRLVCQIAGLDTTYRPKLKSAPHKTRNTQESSLHVVEL